mmetsp:Transcript_2161/g.4970  ORF Transcript_2161/g.4970 Transcript_2161/m.4970 type:complete len:213 (+) Transcript_2161:525-1163(+)
MTAYETSFTIMTKRTMESSNDSSTVREETTLCIELSGRPMCFMSRGGRTGWSFRTGSTTFTTGSLRSREMSTFATPLQSPTPCLDLRSNGSAKVSSPTAPLTSTHKGRAPISPGWCFTSRWMRTIEFGSCGAAACASRRMTFRRTRCGTELPSTYTRSLLSPSTSRDFWVPAETHRRGEAAMARRESSCAGPACWSTAIVAPRWWTRAGGVK